MIKETLKSIFHRDLEKLKMEIESYVDEDDLWRIDKDILNSAGNLCLHLIGNLNTYIGAKLGRTQYVRKRALEFSLKNIPRIELLTKIKDTMAMIDKTLDHLPEADLQAPFPVHIGEEERSIEYVLVHLSTHLTYHLGQINYHRRLLAPNNERSAIGTS